MTAQELAQRFIDKCNAFDVEWAGDSPVHKTLRRDNMVMCWGLTAQKARQNNVTIGALRAARKEIRLENASR